MVWVMLTNNHIRFKHDSASRDIPSSVYVFSIFVWTYCDCVYRVYGPNYHDVYSILIVARKAINICAQEV